MKAFTVWGVWAHAIARLGKRVENRGIKPWDKLLGQRVAIHAGAYVGGRKGKPGTLEALYALEGTCMEAGGSIAWSDYGYGHPIRVRRRPGEWLPIVTSAIVCTAVIAKWEYNPGNIAPEHCENPPPWANPDAKYWWHLEDVEVLAVPVPCKGAQGFWQAPPIPGVTR